MAGKKKRLIHRLEAATESKGARAVLPFDAPEDDEPPVDLAAFITSAVIGLVIVIGVGVWFGTNSIEGKIESQALGTLRANGIRDVAVDVNGLDVTLNGTVRDEDDVVRALRIAAGVEGVATVDTRNVLYVPPDQAIQADTEVEPLVFSWDLSGISVSGTLSDEPTFDSVNATLAEMWPAVDNTELIVKEAIESQRD